MHKFKVLLFSMCIFATTNIAQTNDNDSETIALRKEKSSAKNDDFFNDKLYNALIQEMENYEELQDFIEEREAANVKIEAAKDIALNSDTNAEKMMSDLADYEDTLHAGESNEHRFNFRHGATKKEAKRPSFRGRFGKKELLRPSHRGRFGKRDLIRPSYRGRFGKREEKRPSFRGRFGK